ncbi:MAG TPA: 4-hydroxy-tetrahydrodipicolinate synthase [Candidatus Acidoferrales bacterium]|jgi:4-hydroxy-tetrahydrodipicolinate synthase|nr:4-hydroxy-tetrahydrodipicolinate synthase [Candidatus Acidoferrales bacterium]
MFRGFLGCGTALVTPFRKDLSLDEEVMRKLVRRQIEAGINFLVPCGTTGESPTLTQAEHLRVVAITVEEAKGKVPVLAGAGGYNTHHVIEMAREIEGLGADGILSVTPYYNKPTQEGLYHHFKAIAAATSLPVILYNVPPRTNVNIDPATLRLLSAIENIIGVKEASGNISQITQVFQQVPENFLVFSGDDAITVPLAAMGGKGVISVASNIIPAEMANFAQLCLAGNFAEARAWQRKWTPLLEVNFVETNPTPVKAAMAEMNLLEPVFRLPLVPPRVESAAKIRTVLESLALLERAHVANRS